jgi:ankyrin repeat protein
LTPLRFAVWRDNIEAIELLVANGADVNALTNNGRAPIHYAVSGRAVARLVASDRLNLAITVNATPILHFGRSLPVREALIVAGADIEARNERGETVLMAACVSDDLPYVRLLIEKGADVNASSSRALRCEQAPPTQLQSNRCCHLAPRRRRRC